MFDGLPTLTNLLGMLVEPALHGQPNRDNVYSVNSNTAKESPDGSVTIQFGGCDGKVPNCLPITQEWNYTVRLFLPRREILDGTWRFPESQPVN